MSIFSDGVQFINDFISNESKALNQTIFSATNRSNSSSGGQLQNQISGNISAPTLDHFSSNPIVNMGVDTLNSAVTKVTQQLVVSGTKQLEAAVNQVVGIPVRKTIQDVTDGYYMVTALISTATIEIAMELARTNARTIVSLIGQKEALITTMRGQITSIYNATVIMTNSSPFFTAYYQKLVVAYNDINQADQQFKQVALHLAVAQRYDTTLYNQSLALLNAAEALILPTGANVDSISKLGTLLTDSINLQPIENALGAALTIPGLTAAFGATFLQYVTITLAINALIAVLLTALNAFISSFQRNANIDNNTINHINAGTLQLDSLLSDMRAVLFPANIGTSLLSVPAFQTSVTTSATSWGIRLATTIQWMTIEPGQASQILDVTSESVVRYNKMIANLEAQGNVIVGLADLQVTQSQENVGALTAAVARFLISANTVVGSQQAPANARANVIQMGNYLDCAHILDQNIISYLTPFINTPNELLAGADKVVSQLMKFTKDLGLDRAADLLKSANFTSFFAMNGTTATYAGAAVAGVTAILAGLTTSPTATQSQVSSLTAVQTDFQRKNAVKQVEASRSASDSTPTFVAQQQSNFALDQKQANQAIAVAQGQDATISQDPLSTATKAVNGANGNRFNTGTFTGVSGGS